MIVLEPRYEPASYDLDAAPKENGEKGRIVRLHGELIGRADGLLSHVYLDLSIPHNHACNRHNIFELRVYGKDGNQINQARYQQKPG